MAMWRGRWGRRLHPRRVHKSVAAMTSLASVVSVLVGVLAARAAPHGWHRAFVTLHLSHAPWILKLAPIVAGIAVTFATIGATLSFCLWCMDSGEAQPGPASGSSASDPR